MRSGCGSLGNCIIWYECANEDKLCLLGEVDSALVSFVGTVA